MADLSVAVELTAKDNLSPALDKAKGGMGGFVTSLGSIGLAGAGVKTIFDTVTGVIGGFMEDAISAQKVTAQLNAVLASTQGAAGMTAEGVNAISTSLSQLTPFEDEAITSAQSLLLTFTNIGSDVFPMATETVLNMSTALGQDLSSSSVQLGKALNDPIKGISALSRVGVTFTEDQKAMITGMVEAGDIAGAQAVILGELEKEFGGAAKAAGTTFAGQLVIAQTALGNMKETIGGPVLSVLGSLMEKMIPVLVAFGDKLPGAIEAAQQKLSPITAFISDNIGPILTGLAVILVGVVVPAFVAWATAAAAAAAATIVALLPVMVPLAAVALAVGLLKAAWDNDFGGIQEKTDFVINQVIIPIFESVVLWFTDLQTNLGLMRDFFITAWEAISTGVQTAWTTLSSAATLAWSTLKETLTTGINTFSETWDTVWGAIKTTVDTTWTLISGVVDTYIGIIQTAFTIGMALLSGDWTKAWDTLKTSLDTAGTNISNSIHGVIDGIISYLRTSWDSINTTAGTFWDTIKTTIWSKIEPLLGLVQGLVNGINDFFSKIKVPSLPAPSVQTGGGGPAATTPQQAAQGGIDWGARNAADNAARAHADNVARGRGDGGEPIVGGDLATSGKALAAIQWAMARLGQGGWVGWCERFVENAFGTGGRYASAFTASQAIMTNPGGNLGGAPRGSIVFFRKDASNGNFGHVGISLGGGQMVSATNNGPEVTGMSSYWNSLYAGWGPSRFAKGVRGYGGGWALIGEQGPELVKLGAGSDVYTAQETKGMVGGQTVFNIQGAGTEEVVERINRLQRQRELLNRYAIR